MNDTLLFLANELLLCEKEHVGLIRCVPDMPRLGRSYTHWMV